MLLAGKVALVTGASRGIGKAIAQALAREGAAVALNFRRSREEAETVKREIISGGGHALTVQGDTRLPADIERMVSEIEKQLGTINILVNNAVYALCKPFLEYSVEEWQDQLAYKGLAYFLTSRRVLPAMIQQQEGAIINILSTAAVRDGSGELAYAATNGAAAALTRGLAREFGKFGIRINGILITWAENAFDKSNPAHAAWLDRFALQRVTQLNEVAETAVFLASSKSSGITGSLIPVDAGFLC